MIPKIWANVEETETISLALCWPTFQTSFHKELVLILYQNQFSVVLKSTEKPHPTNVFLIDPICTPLDLKRSVEF